jgi:hypothetical protein
MYNVFAAHARERVEVFGFAIRPHDEGADEEEKKRVEANIEHFIDISQVRSLHLISPPFIYFSLFLAFSSHYCFPSAHSIEKSSPHLFHFWNHLEFDPQSRPSILNPKLSTRCL